MKQYIDKSAVVAEIERKRDAALTRQHNLEAIGQVTVLNETLARELSRIISFINTLEVKEVQEEPVSEDSHIKKSQESCKENGDSLTCEDLERKAVGVGLRFRDELICDGVSREAAEIYAAIAQQKFMDGAKWQEEQFEKNRLASCNAQTSEELEKAAIEAYKKIVEKGGVSFLKIFKAGAEWYASHNTKLPDNLLLAARKASIDMCDIDDKHLDEYPYHPIAEEKFIEGANWQKEQMMKDAIDATIKHTPNDYGEFAPCIYAKVDSTYNEGDKVKVLVIKEEQL